MIHEPEILHILEDGSKVPETLNDKGVVAKIKKNPYNGHISYYIRFENGRMVNPSNRDMRRNTQEQAQWRRVKEHVYLLYLKFLKTRKETFLNRAERSL